MLKKILLWGVVGLLWMVAGDARAAEKVRTATEMKPAGFLTVRSGFVLWENGAFQASSQVETDSWTHGLCGRTWVHFFDVNGDRIHWLSTAEVCKSGKTCGKAVLCGRDTTVWNDSVPRWVAEKTRRVKIIPEMTYSFGFTANWGAVERLAEEVSKVVDVVAPVATFLFEPRTRLPDGRIVECWGVDSRVAWRVSGLP